MIWFKNRILLNSNGKNSFRSLFLLLPLVVFYPAENALSQVITNTGAFFTASSGSVVQTKDIENNTGVVTNNGTLNMSGSFTNADSTSGNGDYNLALNWTNTGKFNAGTSKVTFNGTTNQNITKPGGETFHNVFVNNTGTAPNNQIQLHDNVNIMENLEMKTGNVNSLANILYLVNSGTSSLIYSSVSESRVIGKFERGVNTSANYLFPVGSIDHYNPLNLTPNSITANGSVSSEFVPEAAGDNGLPIPDVFVEVWKTYSTGYWNLKSKNGFSSPNFNISTDAKGFNDPVYFYTRLIKRTNSGAWTTDGIHHDAVGTVAYRDNLTGNISPSGTQFAIAKIRPLITRQPADTSICDLTNAGFDVVATGYIPLNYKWEKWNTQTSTWNSISDSPIYNGSATDILHLSNVPLTFNNNRYRVVIKDTYQNSKDSDSALLVVDPIPVITNSRLADTICNLGSINFNILSDVPGSTYQWNALPSSHLTGGSDGSISLISQTLTNTDTLIENIIYRIRPTGPGKTQCKGNTKDYNVLVAPTLISTATPSVYIGGRNIRCFGENNGSIDINPKGGFYLSPYSYTWKRNGTPFGDQQIQDRGSLIAGNYDVKIKDIIGCTYETSLVLTQPDSFKVAIDSINYVSCAGIKDGAIYTTPGGGTAPFTYKWTAFDQTIPSTASFIQSTRYGLHEVLAKDINNCSFYFEVDVGSENEMQIGFNKKIYGSEYYNISCFGKNDGQITATALGNGPPDMYIYNWMDNLGNIISDEPAISGVTAGSYTIFVTDVAGCEGIKDVELKEPTPISIKKTNLPYPGNYDISCYNLSDGKIDLNVSGGHTDYLPAHFQWLKIGDNSFSKSTKDIDNLTTGSYYVEIIDSFNCQADSTFVLKEPAKINMSSQIKDYHGYQVSCIDSSNSVINLDISGGHGEFRYSWSTSDGHLENLTSRDQSGLPAGNYHLDVHDSINCPAQWDFQITQPERLAVSPVFHLNNGFEVSCFNGNDGSINLNTSGGVTPYRFSWNTTSGSGLSALSENQSGLSKGIYQVSVLDVNDCPASWEFELKQPEKIITSTDTTTISCYANNDGAIDLTVNGGVQPYQYSWNNGENTEDISLLYLGKYTVQITDANNCIVIDSAEVTEPAEIKIKLTAPLQYNGRMISCYGRSDASVFSEVSGGKTNEYFYEWFPGNETGSSISNVPAQMYLLKVTDVNNCTKTDSIRVEQPLKLVAEVYNTNPTCFGKEDGEITLIVRGGNPGENGYSINWNDGQTGQTAINIGNGQHNVIIKDMNECRIDTFGILDQPQLLTLSKEIVNPSCPDIPDGSIRYEIGGGSPPYNLLLNNKITDEFVTDLGNGKYYLKVTDNNLCSLNDTSQLKGISPMCISVPNAFTPNGDGVNDTWIIENIEIYPNVKIEIYNRWGELIYFAPKGYNKPWDGTYKGRELPIDSYYYVIDLNNQRDIITGDITIIK